MFTWNKAIDYPKKYSPIELKGNAIKEYRKRNGLIFCVALEQVYVEGNERRKEGTEREKAKHHVN